jgi:hypothetical protein
VYAGTRQASAAAEHPTSRHILGLEVAQRKKNRASRPFAVRAGAQMCRLTGRLAPSSCPKLALFFRPVSTVYYLPQKPSIYVFVLDKIPETQ